MKGEHFILTNMKRKETGTEWYKRIERDIIQSQDALRKIDPKHSLLELVKVTSISIDYDFGDVLGADYLGLTQGEAMDRYIADLRRATV